MAIRNFHWSSVLDCVMQETDGAGNTLVTYTHEPTPYGPLLSENRGGTESYHHYDALGSTTMLTNDAGTVTDTFQYGAWGNVISRTGTTATPYQWVGRWGYQLDTVNGICYVRARSYQPLVARWSSVDPLHGSHQAAYTYSQNVPIIRIDASGRESIVVTVFHKECTFCGKYELDWQFGLTATSKIQKMVIVQRICVGRVATKCFEGQGKCCKAARLPDVHCCFFEKLGDIVAGQKPNWGDQWGGGGFDGNDNCEGTGVQLTTADVRGFSTQYDNVMNANWDPAGRRKCGPFMNLIMSKTIPGDQTPDWWDKEDASATSFLLAIWNFCGPNFRGATGFYFSTGGAAGSLDCK